MYTLVQLGFQNLVRLWYVAVLQLRMLCISYVTKICVMWLHAWNVQLQAVNICALKVPSWGEKLSIFTHLSA